MAGRLPGAGRGQTLVYFGLTALQLLLLPSGSEGQVSTFYPWLNDVVLTPGGAPAVTGVGASFASLTQRAETLAKCGQQTVNTCASLNYNCGKAEDGCGTELECGTCPARHYCKDNVCRCAPKTCDEEGVTCGELFDGCGSVLACGTCEAGLVCTFGTCTGCDGVLGSDIRLDLCGVCGGGNEDCDLSPRLGIRWNLFPTMDANINPEAFKASVMDVINRVLDVEHEATVSIEYPTWEQNTSAVASFPLAIAPGVLNATGLPPPEYSTMGGRNERRQFAQGAATLLYAGDSNGENATSFGFVLVEPAAEEQELLNLACASITVPLNASAMTGKQEERGEGRRRRR